MAVSADRKHLYSAVRSEPWSVITWNINAANGDLTRQAVTPVSASFPWISLDSSGRYLLAASYDSDVVTTNPIGADGVVSSTVTGRFNTGPHAHSVVADRIHHALYVGNLGADRVLQLRLADNGSLTPLGVGYVEDEKESGPRHSVISADNRWLYNLSEMSGTISQYQIGADGALKRVHRWGNAVATTYHLQHGKQRPANYSDTTPRIWAADIKMTADGRYLYVSERTSSTITGYAINSKDGSLRLIASWPVEKQPRGIAIDDSGKWLVVSGEKSNTVGSYAINPHSGQITRVSSAPCGEDANWVSIVTL